MKDVVWGRLSLPGRAVWVPGHGTDRWVRSRCRTRARVGVTEACGRERGVSTNCATVPGPREHGEGARGHAGEPRVRRRRGTLVCQVCAHPREVPAAGGVHARR